MGGRLASLGACRLRPGRGRGLVAADGQLAASEYEARKRSHQQTLATCAAEGLQFIPLVVEACGGGWAPTAMKTWKGITLQRENARAVLRRLA